jgi:hypothetical protein
MTPTPRPLLQHATAATLIADARFAEVLVTDGVLGMRDADNEPLLRLAALARAIAHIDSTRSTNYLAPGAEDESFCATLARCLPPQTDGL